MILLARALVRLVSFVLLIVLALAGLALAVFSISTGTTGPSLGGLADVLSLASLRDTVGSWFAQLEASGSVAATAALCGLGAMLLGLVLLLGVLVPRRERLVTLDSGDQGVLAARRRPLARAATALVEQVRGVSDVHVRVRPRRRAGGRVVVRTSDPDQVKAAVSEQLRALTDPFELKSRIAVPRRGTRVQ
jgi:hypothetical protein